MGDSLATNILLLKIFWHPHCLSCCPVHLGVEQRKEGMAVRALGLAGPRRLFIRGQSILWAVCCSRARLTVSESWWHSYQAFASSVLMGLDPLQFSLPVGILQPYQYRLSSGKSLKLSAPVVSLPK